MPILGALEILIERRKNPVFKRILGDIRDQVRSGSSISDAFKSHGDMFPSIYAPSLASGERSGAALPTRAVRAQVETVRLVF